MHRRERRFGHSKIVKIIRNINTLCGQNADLLNVKAVGTYGNHFLVYFPYLEEKKLGLCDFHAVRVPVCPPYQFLNA
jgi:hypothetical protein